MSRERQEPWLFFGEDLCDGPVTLRGVGTLVSNLVAPPAKLGVEIVDVPERTSGEERIAQVEDLTLDFSLGENRRLQLMLTYRSESSASPIPSIR